MKFIVTALLLYTVAPLAAAETGQTFTANGVTIWYETLGAGAGVPLIISNGGPGIDHSFEHLGDPVWERLEKTRRVIFYDQRGNGRSSKVKPGDSCNLADQIADLDALRTHLGLDRVDLLGHSWGGYLVMAYSARHPEHIRRLVIVDSAGPKISDTRSLYNDIFPETTAKQDAVQFANLLGDKAAFAELIRVGNTMAFYSPEKREAGMRVLAG